MSTTLVVLLAAVSAWSSSRSAEAAVILQPVSASTNMGEYFPVSRLRDQSGLSAAYTSLATDFDSYVAEGPTAHHGFGANVWGTIAVRSGNLDFALGGSYTISAIAFWSAIGDLSAIRDFNLLASSDPAFNSAINLGSFTASNSVGSGQDTAVQVFSFPATTAAYVRMAILDTWSSSSNGTVANEVAFRATVPEPNIYSVVGMAAAASMMRCHRKRAAAKSQRHDGNKARSGDGGRRP